MSVVKATLIFSIATYLDVILNPLMGFITDSLIKMCYKIYIINIFLGVFMLNITEKSEGEAAKDYVLRQLIYNIVHTNLLPGQKLEAPELCSLMNVSNNPLREAELELAQSKLIEIKPKIGRKFGRRRFFILTGIPLMLLHRNAWQGFTTAILLYRW